MGRGLERDRRPLPRDGAAGTGPGGRTRDQTGNRPNGYPMSRAPGLGWRSTSVSIRGTSGSLRRRRDRILHWLPRFDLGAGKAYSPCREMQTHTVTRVRYVGGLVPPRAR